MWSKQNKFPKQNRSCRLRAIVLWNRICLLTFFFYSKEVFQSLFKGSGTPTNHRESCYLQIEKTVIRFRGKFFFTFLIHSSGYHCCPPPHPLSFFANLYKIFRSKWKWTKYASSEYSNWMSNVIKQKKNPIIFQLTCSNFKEEAENMTWTVIKTPFLNIFVRGSDCCLQTFLAAIYKLLAPVSWHFLPPSFEICSSSWKFAGFLSPTADFSSPQKIFNRIRTQCWPV